MTSKENEDKVRICNEGGWCVARRPYKSGHQCVAKEINEGLIEQPRITCTWVPPCEQWGHNDRW